MLKTAYETLDLTALLFRFKFVISRTPFDSSLNGFIDRYSILKFDPMLSFGGDYGNIHLSIIDFIQKN